MNVSQQIVVLQVVCVHVNILQAQHWCNAEPAGETLGNQLLTQHGCLSVLALGLVS